MSDEKMRAEFEGWLNSQGLESKWQPERNAYEHFAAHFAYRAWVDSRAALVVDLPRVEMGWVDHQEVIEAIEAAGVRVKP